LSKNVFETFENLKLDEKISVKNFLTKEGTESAIKNVDVLKKAKELRSAIDTVGKSLVDAGILPKEVIKQGEGSYLPRLYLKYFGKNSNMGYTKPKKRITSRYKRFFRRNTRC
jgi:hypothetical protein